MHFYWGLSAQIHDPAPRYNCVYSRRDWVTTPPLWRWIMEKMAVQYGNPEPHVPPARSPRNRRHWIDRQRGRRWQAASCWFRGSNDSPIRFTFQIGTWAVGVAFIHKTETPPCSDYADDLFVTMLFLLYQTTPLQLLRRASAIRMTDTYIVLSTRPTSVHCASCVYLQTKSMTCSYLYQRCRGVTTTQPICDHSFHSYR